MANLMETFTNVSATEPQEDGPQLISPTFNEAATEEPMTAQAAPLLDLSEPAVFETAQELSTNEKLSDEAFAAVKRGDLTRIRELLDLGLDVNVRDDKGFTLLMHAAQENETEIGKDLLIRQADPDARNDAGLTAMMLASTGGNVEIAKVLLDEMEDDADSDEICATLAMQHGHMSIVHLIEERRRRAEFNAASEDAKKHSRKHSKHRLAEAGYHGLDDACAKDAESVFASWEKGDAEKALEEKAPEETALQHAAHFIGNLCHSAGERWSRFWHHGQAADAQACKVDDPAATPPAQPTVLTPTQQQGHRFAEALTKLVSNISGL
jgi:hypothetical protein